MSKTWSTGPPVRSPAVQSRSWCGRLFTSPSIVDPSAEGRTARCPLRCRSAPSSGLSAAPDESARHVRGSAGGPVCATVGCSRGGSSAQPARPIPPRNIHLPESSGLRPSCASASKRSTSQPLLRPSRTRRSRTCRSTCSRFEGRGCKPSSPRSRSSCSPPNATISAIKVSTEGAKTGRRYFTTSVMGSSPGLPFTTDEF